MTTIKRDFGGRIIYRMDDLGETVQIRDADGNRKGTYNKRLDITTDENGRQIGSGNLLSILLD